VPTNGGAGDLEVLRDFPEREEEMRLAFIRVGRFLRRPAPSNLPLFRRR